MGCSRALLPVRARQRPAGEEAISPALEENLERAPQAT